MPYSADPLIRPAGGGLPAAADWVILAGFSESLTCECCLIMEINPILNSIKDLSDRTLTIRGYL